MDGIRVTAGVVLVGVAVVFGIFGIRGITGEGDEQGGVEFFPFVLLGLGALAALMGATVLVRQRQR
jgi:hypothetical protein